MTLQPAAAPLTEHHDLSNASPGDDWVHGLEGDDTIDGGGGDDTLDGGDENDRPSGGVGDDSRIGGQDSDTLEGGAGNDVLNACDGSDVFVFDAPSDGLDLITEFKEGEDKIAISSDGFGGLLPLGSLDSDRLAFGAAYGDQGQFVYDEETGSLSWDADGAGEGASVAFVTLGNAPPLSASDFLIGA